MKSSTMLRLPRILAMIALLLSLATVALGEQEQATPMHPTAERVKASGSISGNVYTNNLLGFSYDFPSHLTVETERELNEVMDVGHKAGWGTEPESDPEHQQAKQIMIPLLSLVGKPRKPGEVPEQVLIWAMDVSANPQLSAPLLLGQLVMGMVSPWRRGPGTFKLRGDPGVGVEKIDGQEMAWGALEGRVAVQGKERRVYTALWVTVRNGYAVIWSLAAGDKKQLSNLEKTMPSLRLNLGEPRAEAPR